MLFSLRCEMCDGDAVLGLQSPSPVVRAGWTTVFWRVAKHPATPRLNLTSHRTSPPVATSNNPLADISGSMLGTFPSFAHLGSV